MCEIKQKIYLISYIVIIFDTVNNLRYIQMSCNTVITQNNTSHGWSVEKIKNGDKILVCNMNCFNTPLITCDSHTNGVRIAQVEKIEKFGGTWFINTTEGEMTLTLNEKVTFFTGDN